MPVGSTWVFNACESTQSGIFFSLIKTNYGTMKYILMIFTLFTLACGDSDGYDSANSTTDSSKLDNMPVVTPGSIDTSSVVTPPPTGDSNVVNPDTAKTD